MDPTVTYVLIPLGVAVVAASGAWLTTLVSLRGKARDDRQLLIDQLQEERNWQAEERRKERVEFAEELRAERAQIAAERDLARRESDRFWADKASSRVYVGMLRAHINAVLPPPPPNPPEGYIE